MASALAAIHPGLPAAALLSDGKIDPHVIAGVLGVDNDSELVRQNRGLARGAERSALSTIVSSLQSAGITLPSVKSELGVGAGSGQGPKKTPGKTPGSSGKTPGRPPKTGASDTAALNPSAAVLMTPEEVIAAAYLEAQEKRDAAETAVAGIGDLRKIAQVRDDALKPKPTTTAGRLIKAANNALERAEKIKAGGGGDGRALRVQGVRKSGGAKTPGGGVSGKPGRPNGAGATGQQTTRPSEALLMERVGDGSEAFVFAPPLAKSPRAVAAEAYALVAEEANAGDGEKEEDAGEEKNEIEASGDPDGRIETPTDAKESPTETKDSSKETRGDEKYLIHVAVSSAPKRELAGKELTEKDSVTGGANLEPATATGGGKRKRDSGDAKKKSDSGETKKRDDAETKDTKDTEDSKEDSKEDTKDTDDKKTKAKAKAKPKPKKTPKTGAAGWGDGGRELIGDSSVTSWLEQRGFGEYAAAFAGAQISRDKLQKLTMQDIEQIPVEGEATRGAIWRACQLENAERVSKEDVPKSLLKKTGGRASFGPATKPASKAKISKEEKQAVPDPETAKEETTTDTDGFGSREGGKRKRVPKEKASV